MSGIIQMCQIFHCIWLVGTSGSELPVRLERKCGQLELSEAGPGLRALPRSKQLRFRFSGTPQRRRFRWASILCPSPFRAVQVIGAWRVQSPPVGAATYHLPYPWHSVFWMYNRRGFLGVLCVSPGELISGCDPHDRCRPSGIQRSLGYQRSLLAVW